MKFVKTLLTGLLVCCLGCSSENKVEVAPVNSVVTDAEAAETPTPISVAYSEYPSWSTFGVAEAKGLIDGRVGQMGPVEKAWNVDIELKLLDYDPCLTNYGAGLVDIVCIANADLPAVAKRKTIVVAPTSTSAGADALIVNKSVGDLSPVDTLKKLASEKIAVRGLEKSVSQYAFSRILKAKGLNPADYSFTNLDPAAAASAMAQNSKEIQAIMVWNPFVLQTLRTNDNAKLILDTREIPESVVDCLAMGAEVAERKGANRAVCCVLDAFYRVDAMLNDTALRETTLVSLGEKFCSLPAADMAICTEQTKFYSTPADAIKLFESDKFQKVTMPDVAEFAVEYKTMGENVTTKPTIAFEKDADIKFTTTYLKEYVAKSKK